ncbi:5-methylthioadenosine/S-adenosylhomocysteine deaminase [Actinocorallia herbida]|uniref:5-methylthioadenosine/S-adenosylhomocysteine deaminase n=1 Tax=Actinocorallia herbida TaxID=58109 RepID=A0A3N1CT35_9ACTN|nr:amidohydrolase family protein [Actinocorallia herbida]ROO84477.1 5-methylthioadenosine/S-adenosylhomocysteine deaminase [Actinocorallia herbida]
MTDQTSPGAVVDATVYTGGAWIPHQDVLFTDGVVTAIRDHVPGTSGIDGSGAHVVPGFVNTHTHLQQTLMRGVGEGLPLLTWLLSVAEDTVALTPEQAYLAAASGALEALRSGTTTLVEHMWPSPSSELHDAVMQALEDVGIRAVFGRGVTDRVDATRKWGSDPRLVQPLEEALAHTDALAARAAKGDGRITMALAVPNPRCLTPEGMAVVREFAEARDMTVSIHLLETTTDDDMCRAHTGLGAVDFLEASGFLWDRLLAVHCVELSPAGMAKLAARGVAVSYNPVSNMRLGSGVAPVPAMLSAGLGVGLGVDGAASNDTQDMLESLRMGSYVQRAFHRRADLLPAPEMLDLAFSGANRALGLPASSGGVTLGAPADLTLLRFSRDFAVLPVRDPSSSLLTTATPRLVDTVLVAGTPVLADGRSTRLDETDLTTRLLAL